MQSVRPWLKDLLAAVAVAAVAGTGALTGAGTELGVPLAADLSAAGLAAVAVGFSRVLPAPVLVLSAVAEIGYLVAGWSAPALIVAVTVALYRLAMHHSPRVTWTLAIVCGIGGWAGSVLGTRAGWWMLPSLSYLAWAGMAAAAGYAVRNRRAYIAEVEERARRVERDREDEVRRRVADERLRIARELHDVVAHHIAVINVQSGAATYALTRRPEAATAPLAHIRRASATVLKELTSIVGLHRQPGDGEPDHQPHPGLDRLPALIESFAATGVDVRLTRLGDTRTLPAVTDLAAYRIVQEGLTNARKHGTGPVRVTVTFTRTELSLDLTNGVPPGPRSQGSGYGLIGMRERAAAAGGTVDASFTTDDEFAVRAVFPAPARSEEQP
ncbi:sensor histidine kinase [Winogradskya consettensis]|nr:histidine kinase [Actinoplanes consettensis]